jgi:hypothetical protein
MTQHSKDKAQMERYRQGVEAIRAKARLIHLASNGDKFRSMAHAQVGSDGKEMEGGLQAAAGCGGMSVLTCETYMLGVNAALFSS